MPVRTYAVEIKLTFHATNPGFVKKKIEELLANPVVDMMAKAELSNPRFLLMPPTATEATLWVYIDATSPEDALVGKRKVKSLLENPLVGSAIRSQVPGGRLAFSPHPPQPT